MKAAVALLSLVAGVCAQGVTSAIAPKASAPAGCSGSFSGDFQVTVAVVKKEKRDEPHQRMKRSTCGTDGALLLKLANGILTDSKGRTGYIASNYQFQFDGPPQAGAIYTAGFSVCGNDSLALGGSTTWWQCKSGDFYNLYDRNWAAQCEAVEIIAMSCDGTGSNVAQSNDGQVVATQVITTTIVKPLTDGQPQVITTTIPVPICQIGDGQIQGHTTPCASITPTTAPTGVPVSQFSDGQIQVTTPATTQTGAPVSEYTDGQVQVTTPAATVTGVPVSEFTDGQVQVTTPATVTGAPVSEYTDGQVQVTTPAPVTTTPAFKTSAKGNSTSTAPGTTSPVPITTSSAIRASAGLGSFVALVMSMIAAYLLL
ncbi:hypothetical protein SBRCBS47491_007970 [Sporothrix bragantina]|uniref:Cell wall mannoprotein PIR1-like C-terminal domain-containing protein n=1 Tax=Sporothrix bragantina TaxID=671064 RepID=A0ABP0CHH8_9PEZI